MPVIGRAAEESRSCIAPIRVACPRNWNEYLGREAVPRTVPPHHHTEKGKEKKKEINSISFFLKDSIPKEVRLGLKPYKAN